MSAKFQFSEGDINVLKSKLAERKHALLESRAAFEEEARELTGEATGEIGHIKTHLGDLGGIEANREVSIDILQHLDRELRDIRAAESRLATGTYGRCEGCSKEIPRARLFAVPEAELCESCQKRREAGMSLVSNLQR